MNKASLPGYLASTNAKKLYRLLMLLKKFRRNWPRLSNYFQCTVKLRKICLFIWIIGLRNFVELSKVVISLLQIWVIESTSIDVKTSNHKIENTLNPILFLPVMRKTKLYQSIGRSIAVNVIKFHCPIGRIS